MKIWSFFLLLMAGVSRAIAAQPDTSPADAPAASQLLAHIVVADSSDTARNSTIPANAGFVLLTPSLSFLDNADLVRRLESKRGQPIDGNLPTVLGQIIEEFVRSRGHPSAVVEIPTQNIAGGVLRLVLLLKPVMLRQIIVAESVEAAQQFAASPNAGFVVLAPSLSFLNRAELAKRLAAGENKVVNERLLAGVAQVVENFVRQESPFAATVIPPQNMGDGTLRLAVTLQKVRNIKVAGNRWFSDSLLREKLRIEKGGTVRISDLDRALGWVNNNPFRSVRVQVDPASSGGEIDLLIAVQEAMPLRLSTMVDTAGNAIIGDHRYTASVSYANLWGLDHQGSYQFITTNLGPRTFQGHGLDYRVPLKWQHYLQFSASYMHAQPEFFSGAITRNAKNITGTVRYTVPLRTGDSPAEFFGAFDFKQSNNNLAWGGDVIDADNADIFQFTVGGSSVHRDKLGAWAFGGSLTASPGGLSKRNNDEAYVTRLGAEAAYIYGSLSLQRLIKVGSDCDFMSRAVVQRSSGNLLASEQLTIGGASTVRGFRESIFAGEEGFVFSNELHLPAWRVKVSFPNKRTSVLETRLIGFYDAAQVFYKHHYPKVDATNGQQVGWDDDHLEPLASAGVGLRMSIAGNFSLSADYGWQLTRQPFEGEDRSRGHIKATLAF